MIVKNLTKIINGKTILDDVSFTLDNNSKIGLIGNNGAGKSTLLKIIAGEIPIDSGKIINKETIGMLRQEISPIDYEYGVLDYIKKESGIMELEKKLHELENNLNEDNMSEYGNVLEKFMLLNGYSFDENVSYILSNLELDIDKNQKVKYLSGGEKIKVLLTTLLLKNPDLLLLDEPTNNLDINSITFLEDYLQNLNKKMIIVSHDEDFLNNITNKILELKDGKIIEYNLSFSDYLKYKDLEYQKELSEYTDIQKQKKKIKNQITEAKTWTNKGLNKKSKDNDKIAAGYAKERTKKTSGKISELYDKLNSLDNMEDFRKKEEINFKVNEDTSKGNKDIILDNLVCGYENFQTTNFNLVIPFGSRINIQGPNGSGKTTLIKTIIGEINPKEGNIYIGNGVKLGYISQNTIENERDQTIYEFLTENLKDIDNSFVFNVLSKFHIDYSLRNFKYKDLSPGQRTRVNLAKLAIDKINVIILDEVTNHLDLEAIHLIENVLQNFDGTIISISHNRHFNESLDLHTTLNILDGTISHNIEKKLKK